MWWWEVPGSFLKATRLPTIWDNASNNYMAVESPMGYLLVGLPIGFMPLTNNHYSYISSTNVVNFTIRTPYNTKHRAHVLIMFKWYELYVPMCNILFVM